MLKKDNFKWNPKAQNSFDNLKKLMCPALVLKLPDFKKAFTIEINASRGGIGAVSMQEGHLIAFLSKALSVKTWVYQFMRKNDLL